MNLIEKTIAFISPGYAFKRARNRAMLSYMERAYDSGKKGSRTFGWNTTSNSERQDIAVANPEMRKRAQDLVQNNPIAAQAVETISNYVVGPFGFKLKLNHKNQSTEQLLNEKWKAWANTTACDADGMLNLAGIERLVMTEVVTKGAVLIRYRARRKDDGLPIPLQLQVLDIAHLDNDKNQERQQGKNKIFGGIEYDARGKIVAYHVFPEHPSESDNQKSQRLSADSIKHIYRKDGATYYDGITWFHSILLRLKDFDDYFTNQSVKQKLATCFTMFVTNAMPEMGDDSSPLVGGDDDDSGDEIAPSLGPGYFHELGPGQDIKQAEPTNVGSLGEYATWMCRLFSTGLGITYEMLINDLSGVNYSSARVGHVKAARNVRTWQMQIMTLQFCEPTLEKFLQFFYLETGKELSTVSHKWVTPTIDLIDPQKTAQSSKLEVENGFKTHEQVVMEYGNDPDDHYESISKQNEKLDKFGIKFACDTRGIKDVKETN